MTETESERAILRLEQLAREEAAAVDAEDIDALCRISELLPDVTADVLNGTYPASARLDDRVSAILSSHRCAEAFLSQRISETREALRLIGGGQRASSGYGNRSSHTARIHSEG